MAAGFANWASVSRAVLCSPLEGQPGCFLASAVRKPGRHRALLVRSGLTCMVNGESNYDSFPMTPHNAHKAASNNNFAVYLFLELSYTASLLPIIWGLECKI